MDQKMKWVMNAMPKTDDKNLPVMSVEEVKKARAFHESFPQYEETPLTKLNQMAAFLGVNSVFIKDESYRFGLNAFKVLGGSYSMARYIAKETGKDVSELPYSVLTSDKLHDEFGTGYLLHRHRRQSRPRLAWAAQKLHQNAVVHMPKGSTQTRLEHIRKVRRSKSTSSN
jgi:diaminopropionate ammonia-lyase